VRSAQPAADRTGHPRDHPGCGRPYPASGGGFRSGRQQYAAGGGLAPPRIPVGVVAMMLPVSGGDSSRAQARARTRPPLSKTQRGRRQAAKLCYRFGPLTPSARCANLIAGDGTKNGFPPPNKEPIEPITNQKLLLDTKSPIQVRIHLPPSLLTPASFGGPTTDTLCVRHGARFRSPTRACTLRDLVSRDGDLLGL
jgi:hypothetical protein